MQKYLYFILSSFFLLTSCTNSRIKENKSWKGIFEKHQLSGGFEIYDNNKDVVFYSNKEICSTRVAPGNTFFVFSSVIGLESSAVLDDTKPIYWVSKLNDSLDKEGTIRTFYKEQNELFFSHLAKEITPLKMKEYMDTIKYGNMEVGNDVYWNDGSLLISLDEQVGLMKRIYFNELPFISTRSTTIVKSMMQVENKDDYTLYYQIAPAAYLGKNYVWIIGFAESFNPLKNPETNRIDNVVHPYFFSGLIQDVPEHFDQSVAKDLMMDLLKDYQVIK